MPYRLDDPVEAGDLVWVDFEPPVGHEQSGRRPAFVVSPSDYHAISALIIVCPITRSRGAWPFKVEVRATRIQGAILVDQVRSIDRTSRFVRRAERASAETLDRVRGMLAAVLGIPVSN